MEEALVYELASEAELNKVMQGEQAAFPTPWPNGAIGLRMQSNQIGVLLKVPKNESGTLRPLALIVPPAEARRLFGRFSQNRADLSPLSAWCHILAPDLFSSMDGPARQPEYLDAEAAWTGLVVAEALLLADRPLSRLKIAACLATQSFAIARTSGLWGNVSLQDVLARYDLAQKVCGKSDFAVTRLREMLTPIWSALLEFSMGTSMGGNNTLVDCFYALSRARVQRETSASYEAEALLNTLDIPEADILRNLSSMTPEMRVREFDRLMAQIERLDGGRTSVRTQSLMFLAGYLATVAAGGSPSLSLVEPFARPWPEITALAYIIGSIGEKVIWTSSFDGLGRLVARELVRPFRIDEPPTADFSLDEADVLVDRQLSDPLVHLRVKQMRSVAVTLFAGVNVFVALSENSVERRFVEPERAYDVQQVPTGNLSDLANALWPFFRDKMRSNDTGDSGKKTNKTRQNPKRYGQSKLPLDR